MTEDEIFVIVLSMEAKDENTFFGGQSFSKNLLLVEEKDKPHLLARIKKKIPGEFFFFGEDHQFSDLMKEIMQPSLFGEKKVMIVFASDSYTEENWEEIFDQNHAELFFFKKTAKKSLVDRFIKKGAILRLLEEKPWDRKNRLVAEVVYTIHKDGVMISQPTAYRFVDRVFMDLQLFHNELTKLRAYSYGKKKIDDTDIDAIVKPLPEENGFKVSEEIIWKGTLPKNYTIDNSSSLLQIIGAFRFQAYLGLKMVSKESVKVPQWQEKKYKQKALSYGAEFFKKILTILFKTEERAKQTAITPKALFDLVSCEIASLSRKCLSS